MEQLVKKLNQAAKMYYSGNGSMMSDKEYDKLYEQLEKMEKETGIILPDSPTRRVGYQVVSKLPKVTHEYPALSLDKTKSVEELIKWANGKEIILSWKLDGLTLQVTYEKGIMEKCVTRGNGIVGEDVSHNAPYIQGLPQKIPYQGKLVVRGEVLISYADFDMINEDGEYKNPRNLASSSLRLLDSYTASKRCMHFKAFTLVFKEDMPSKFTESLGWLKEQGLDTVEFAIVDNMYTAVREFEKKVVSYEFPTDGLVATFNDIAYGQSLGTTGKFPKHSIAFKWKDDTEETILRDIDWSASRTGLINPVAVFDPVELEGTTVKRASIHNIRYIEKLKLGYGDTITIYKANKIIPMIDDNLTKNGNYIPIPEVCPVCGGKTERRVNSDDTSESLYCTNPQCPAKHIGRYTRLVERDGLNVIGLSKAAIEKFVDSGFLHEFRDLYHLQEYKDQILEMEGMGEKSYQNMIDAIESSRTTTFRQFFYSLGIPEAGHDVAKILEKECSRRKTRFFEDMAGAADGVEKFQKMSGIGEVIAQNLCCWYKEHKEEYQNLLYELTITDDEVEDNFTVQDLVGKTFVITGKLETYPNRDALKSEIESRGGKVSGSVSKNTTYLINNDTESMSGKNKKAKELGITVISESDFKNLFSKNVIS